MGIKLYNSFKPMLTPKKMLNKGIFGGTYFNQLVDYRIFPEDWFSNLDETYFLSKIYNKKINYFNIKSGQSQEEWELKGWIHKDDPRGWFEWYCKYFSGRRHEDDERQIKRWAALAGKRGRFSRFLVTQIINKNGKWNDESISPKIRQVLQHWGYKLTKKDYENELARRKQVKKRTIKNRFKK